MLHPEDMLEKGSDYFCASKIKLWREPSGIWTEEILWVVQRKKTKIYLAGSLFILLHIFVFHALKMTLSYPPLIQKYEKN